MRVRVILFTGLLAMGLGSYVAAETVVLKPAKDTFMRANNRNRNSGKNPYLVLAHSPAVRAIMAFDLSGVTNKILSAKLRLNMNNEVEKPISLQICPMINNSTWKEGIGALGTKGQNNRGGEVCWAFCGFSDKPWVGADGTDLVDISQAALWERPLYQRSSIKWIKGEWITCQFGRVAAIEAVRDSEAPMVTLGLWGVSGDGLYFISSRESMFAPELLLQVEEGE